MGQFKMGQSKNASFQKSVSLQKMVTSKSIISQIANFEIKSLGEMGYFEIKSLLK